MSVRIVDAAYSSFPKDVESLIFFVAIVASELVWSIFVFTVMLCDAVWRFYCSVVEPKLFN